MDEAARDDAVRLGEAAIAALQENLEKVRDGSLTLAEDFEHWGVLHEYADAVDDLLDAPVGRYVPASSIGIDVGTTTPVETEFTVRARYDYIVRDPAFGAAEGIGRAVYELLHEAGRPFAALEVDALETGSGFVVVHEGGAPLQPSSFGDPEATPDLLIVGDDEELLYVLDEPVFDSQEEAEAAARRASGEVAP